MILRTRAEEILSLVQKTEREISFSDEMIVGDVCIGTGETDAVRFIARAAKELSELEIVATYNLLFNASLMVEEGLGYAIGLDKIINTTGNNTLCFRPLSPQMEAGMHIIWKKYQVFSKTSEKFIEKLKSLSLF